MLGTALHRGLHRESVKPVKRGVASARKGTMYERLGPVALSLECTSRSDLEVEFVVEKLRNCLVVDREDGHVDVLTADGYERALEQEGILSAHYFQ